jgi:hypothetical protein
VLVGARDATSHEPERLRRFNRSGARARGTRHCASLMLLGRDRRRPGTNRFDPPLAHRCGSLDNAATSDPVRPGG